MFFLDELFTCFSFLVQLHCVTAVSICCSLTYCCALNISVGFDIKKKKNRNSEITLLFKLKIIVEQVC